MDIDKAKKKIALELEEALSLDKAPSIDVEATLDLLFRFLDYKPDDKSISGESGLLHSLCIFFNKRPSSLAPRAFGHAGWIVQKLLCRILTA